jgi:hypothetical protein
MIERPSPSVSRDVQGEAPTVEAPAPRMVEIPRTGPSSPPSGTAIATVPPSTPLETPERPAPVAVVPDAPVAPVPVAVAPAPAAVAPIEPSPRARQAAAPPPRARQAAAPPPRARQAAAPPPRPARSGRSTPDPAAPSLQIEDGETTLFEAAVTAFHAGEFQRAESLFLEEAEGSVDVAPQRAAIAFRQAALAAKQAGNMDGSDHWMRLAGREYLKVSEDDRTPLPYIREAALMAAKCFLSVENLHVASKGLRRAQAIESVLGADDDLLADAPGIPFRHGDTAPAPAPVNGAERPGAGQPGAGQPGAGHPGTERRSPDSVGAGLRAGAAPGPGTATAARRPGWIRRLRPDHAAHGAA